MTDKQTSYSPRPKLRAKRKSERLSTAALGALSGMDGTLIGKIELGNRPIKIDQLERLAKALACPVADLLEEGEAGASAQRQADRPTVYAASQPHEGLELDRVMVRGEVAAGVWREAIEWPEYDWFPVQAPQIAKYSALPQFGLMVRGQSMNLVFPEGSVIICVPLIHMGRAPKSGDFVVVEAKRSGLVEATVKEYQEKNGRIALVPRSTHPAFQLPINIGPECLPFQTQSPQGMAEAPVKFEHPSGFRDGDEITVTALVVGVFKVLG